MLEVLRGQIRGHRSLRHRLHHRLRHRLRHGGEGDRARASSTLRRLRSVALLGIGLVVLLMAADVQAHPGNVFAAFSPTTEGDQVQLSVALTFENTGEPLLGARLWWAGETGGGQGPEQVPPEQRDPALPELVYTTWGKPGTLFQFGGGPHIRVSRLPIPTRPTRYTLQILSLGETTDATFVLEPGADPGSVKVVPELLLLVFPDVGIPDYQAVLVAVLIVVGMVAIVGRGTPDAPAT